MISMLKDSLGKGGTTFSPPGVGAARDGTLHSHWYGQLSDGMAVGLVAAGGAATMSLDFKNVPGLGSGAYVWEEMFTGKTGNGTSVSFSLASHDMAFLKLTIPTGNTTAGSTLSNSNSASRSSSAAVATPSSTDMEEVPIATPANEGSEVQQPAQESNPPVSSSPSGCTTKQFS